MAVDVVEEALPVDVCDLGHVEGVVDDEDHCGYSAGWWVDCVFWLGCFPFVYKLAGTARFRGRARSVAVVAFVQVGTVGADVRIITQLEQNLMSRRVRCSRQRFCCSVR